MDDQLRTYLAGQNAAVSPADGQEPQSDDDPDAQGAPTDLDADEETPEDGTPGDDGDDEEEDEESDAESAPPPGPNPEVERLRQEREALARERDEARQAANQAAVQVQYERLQARWAQMDPEDAEREKNALVQSLATQRQQILEQENQGLRQRLEQLDDTQRNKPGAIAFLTQKHRLDGAEAAYLQRFDDPISMTIAAETFAERRKLVEQEARREARRQRQGRGADRIGTAASGTASAPPVSTGDPLRDYLNEQKAALRQR